MADAEAKANAAAALFEETLKAIDAKAEIAFAEIDSRRAQAGSVLNAVASMPVLGQAAATVGLSPDGLLVSLGGVLGLGGIGYHSLRVRGERKAKDRAVDQAKRDRDEHDSTWDEARDDTIRQMLPLLTAIAVGKSVDLASLTPPRSAIIRPAAETVAT